MKRIIAKWNDELETVPSDSKIEEWADSIISTFRSGIEDLEIEICSLIQMHAFIVNIRRKKISNEELLFYDIKTDNEIGVDKIGRREYISFEVSSRVGGKDDLFLNEIIDWDEQ
jgi:hypothetical protein